MPDPFQGVAISELMKDNALLEQPKSIYVYPDHKLSFAMELMGKYGLDSIDVVRRNEPQKIIGKIEIASALEYYSQYKQKDYQYHSPHYLQSKRRKVIAKSKRFMQKIIN